ncbi:monocyte differentiation antigen CD14 [Antechinus flavipes]|uniref:monocyte differentiation antigen CD14 n=1 Tax=Antechinus flavipes TaxID=38775 RepID=UPI0022360D9A|nr:monocyte differentiation antigen CD14 [Antechinus flavipes]
MVPWQRLSLPLLLLLLSPLLLLPWPSSAICILDEEGDNCFCNFSTPEPNWNSLQMCLSSVEVEIHGGGHNLDIFLPKGGLADPRQAADLLRSLRLKRLKLKDAQVPAPLLYQLLQALTYTRTQELSLEDLGVSHPPLQPRSPSDHALALKALKLNRVSPAGEGDLMAAILTWLKPGLKTLSLTDSGLSSVPCSNLGTFKELSSLDLSDNPAIGESGLTAALCLKEFQELRDLALRNTSLQSLGGVCGALEARGVKVQRLDISYNELRDTPSTQCTWPPTLTSLNLSHAKLKCVPKSLPQRLQQLDLSHNLLTKQPTLDQVTELVLEGNPFTQSSALARSRREQAPEECAESVPSRGSRPFVGSPLAFQVFGTAAFVLLCRVRRFA